MVSTRFFFLSNIFELIYLFFFLFTRHWDISSHERFEMLKEFTNNGLEHWGSDNKGVENTRRFLLEWLSFLHRYARNQEIFLIPLGKKVSRNLISRFRERKLRISRLSHSEVFRGIYFRGRVTQIKL